MNNIIIWICRILIGLTAIVLLVTGFLWAFMPEANLKMNGISAESVLAINTIKANIGGTLLFGSIISFLYLFKGREWFLPNVIYFTSLVIVRSISLLTDGYHQTNVIGIVVEVLFLIAVSGLNRHNKITDT